MPLLNRRAHRLVVVLVALAVGLLATVVTGAGARDSGSPPGAAVHIQDGGGPRNPAAEAATGDTNAMLAVVRDALGCLREKGFHPGDPRVNGENVVTPDWNPAPDSPPGRATSECFFPVR